MDTKESYNENLQEGEKQAPGAGGDKGRTHSKNTGRLLSQNSLARTMPWGAVRYCCRLTSTSDASLENSTSPCVFVSMALLG